ncbi:MAG: ABC transporter permease [Phyllobacteriaceae bacterium]|nr:ABC transporter permease [Phyllobacteriaceae bacterium]
MFAETVLLAFLSIRRNKMRSFLTLLGIVIGVAAVIAMITIGAGTTTKVKQDIGKLGSNLLIVRSGTPPSPGQSGTPARAMTDREARALKNGLPDARSVAAQSQKAMTVVFGTESIVAQVVGADADYFDARDWVMSTGRPFGEAEERSGLSLCAIGETVRKQFFGGDDGLGANIRVGKTPCRVIGVLEAKGTSSFGQDQDATVIMPLTAFQRRISGSSDVDTIFVAGGEGGVMADLQNAAEDILRDVRHVRPTEDDDFNVRDMTQIADAMASTTKVMSGMLGAVAAVSLLVGGIGIMNIMLVSVTERTREIGIRLAIGAQERHILVQFLVEATVLSALGGVAGVGLGLFLSWLASYFTGIPFEPDISTVALAVGFSAVIGMVFGFFPALRGARLDPIDALRHE